MYSPKRTFLAVYEVAGMEGYQNASVILDDVPVSRAEVENAILQKLLEQEELRGLKGKVSLISALDETDGINARKAAG